MDRLTRGYKLLNNSIVVGLFLICWLSASCKKPTEIEIDSSKTEFIKIDEQALDTTFKLNVDHSSLHYVVLKTNKKDIVSFVSQVKIYRDKIYLLNNQQGFLYIFDIKGNLLKKLTFFKKHLINFDITNHAVYLLEKDRGDLYQIDLSSYLIKTLHLGFHGVQFAALSDSTFLFNTCGLKTADKYGDDFQLTVINKTGEIIHVGLPTTQIEATKYYFKKQLNHSDNQIVFTSAFKNAIYSISPKAIKAIIKIDFGRYNLTDSILMQLYTKNEFGNLPYVTDLAVVSQTDKYSLFSFTFRDTEGYIIYNHKTRQIISAGVGVQCDANSDYNNTIPAGSYNNELFTLLSPEEYDLNMRKAGEIYNKTKSVDNKSTGIINPVIMFYSLR